VDTVAVEVPGDQHWTYKHFDGGKLLFRSYVTLSADGNVHEIGDHDAGR